MTTQIYPGRSAVKHLGSLYRCCLAVIIVTTPLLVTAQQDEEDATEATEATEIEQAPVVGQVELEDAPVIPATEIEEIVVTGTRIARTPEELAGNLTVLDGDFIRASGEATLERVLRQLPQNANPTAERFGSNLNTVQNFTGASTVNLRGLGSESTLILVDGKRIGHSGFLGGVTDVSTIPLSMVERIDVLLDGASAIYGSDAVGGVINIITRKDYQGIELDLNYSQPSDGSYDEWFGTISGGFLLGETRIRASYNHSGHSGLDGADRQATLFDRLMFSGPQFDIRFCCSAEGMAFPIIYRLDGDVLTQPEYNALSPEDQSRATAETHAVLPPGFNQDSSVDEITQFGLPDWGVETQAGWHVLPENQKDGFTFSIDRDLGAYVSAEARVRYESRETTYDRGYTSITGQSFAGRNPFNPFGRSVHLRGQRQDLPPVTTETESDTLDLGLNLEGSFGDSDWGWEANLGFTSQDTDSLRINSLDTVRFTAGLGSDGVTPSTQFLFGETAESCAEKGGSLSFGLCRVSIPAPPAANPFGDLTPYINDPLNAVSTNEQTRFDALLRGPLWSLPAGDVSALLGFSSLETVLDSELQFSIGTTNSPIGDIDSFSTDASRSNQAVYMEGLVPLMGGVGDRSLNLSLSARWDSYDAPDVIYRDTALGTTEKANDLPDAGSATTWGAGLVFSPAESLRFRLNRQTSFVAPQLNQLLRRKSESEVSGFQGLFVQLPNGNLSFEDALIFEGGNPDLKSETADTLNVGAEYTPSSLPGLNLKVTWSVTDFKDRINKLNIPIIDSNNLPSNTIYIPEEDLYIQERRWINVSKVDREGLDLEAFYTRETAAGEFSISWRHSRTSKYDVVLDPASDETISHLDHLNTNNNTIIPVVSKSATTAQFTWRQRGLDTILDVSTQSKTSKTFAGVTNTYEPPTILDLTLSYSFVEGGLLGVPGWAEGARVSFTVNNLGNDFGETSVVNDDGEELTQSISDSSPLYGRVYNMTIHVSL